MSTNLPLHIAASPAAGSPRFIHRSKAYPISLATSVRRKTIIALTAVALALLYAKGVTLMIDAPDTPNSYTVFIYHGD
jgi:hypothetical protein